MQHIYSAPSLIPAFAGKVQDIYEIEATNSVCEPGTYRVGIVGDTVTEVLVKRNGRFANLNPNAHHIAFRRLGAYVKSNR